MREASASPSLSISVIIKVIAAIAQCLAAGFALGLPTHAVLAQTAPPALSPAEQYVLDQVNQGNEADLATQFPGNADDRVLSAAFMERLLTSPVSRRGIIVRGAVFNDPIDLSNIDVADELDIDNSHFIEPVNFAGARFERNVRLFNNHFESAVSFLKAHVSGDFSLSSSIFDDAFVLSGAIIDGDLLLDDCAFTNTLADVQLSSAEIGGSLILPNAHIAGVAAFDGAKVGGSLNANGAQFTNTDAPANFRQVSVNDVADFSDARIAGDAVFAYGNFASQFSAPGAQFAALILSDAHIGQQLILRNALATAVDGASVFDRLAVNDSVDLTAATFNGSASFDAASVARSFDATNAVFSGTFSLENGKTGEDVVLDGATFNQGASFDQIGIDGQLRAADAKFKDSVRWASFSNMLVQNDARFESALFNGPVTFAESHFGDDVVMDEAHFAGTQHAINFNSMLIGGTFALRGTVFDGDANFQYQDIGVNLEAQGVQFTDPLGRATFSSSLIRGSMFIGRDPSTSNDSLFAGDADFSYLQTYQELSGLNAHFSGRVTFEAAKFGGDVRLNGARFDSAVSPVSFKSMRVDGSVGVIGASFAATTTFDFATVSGSFEANGAQFGRIEGGKTNPGASFFSMDIGEMANFNPDGDGNETMFAGFFDISSSSIGGDLRLRGAHLHGPAYLGSVKTKGLLVIARAEFDDSAAFDYGEFGAGIEAGSAQFNSADEPVSFNSVTSGGTVFFRPYTADDKPTYFAGRADFGYSIVRGYFYAQKTVFAKTDDWVSFVNSTIDGSLRLTGAVMSPTLDCTGIKVGRAVQLTDGVFYDTAEGVLFNSASIGGDVMLSRAKFYGPFDLAYASVGVTLDASGAEFFGADNKVSFNNTKINSTAFINDAFFHGTVNFSYSEIKGNLEAGNSEFDSSGLKRFDNMTIGGAAFFADSVFNGPVDFKYSVIGSNFEAGGAAFRSLSGVDFSGIKVLGSLHLREEAWFVGPVDMRYANIGVNLDVGSADFSYDNDALNLNNVAVGLNFVGEDAKFQGGLDLNQVRIGAGLNLKKATLGGQNISLNAAQVRVGGDAELSNMTVKQLLRFSGSTITGRLTLTSTVVSSDADFSFTSVGQGFLASGARFTRPDAQINLRNMLVRGSMSLSDAQFAGIMDMTGANISGPLIGERVQYSTPQSVARFTGMVVDGDIRLPNAIFSGTSDLSGTTIRGSLVLTGAQFTADQPARFDGVRVTGDLALNSARFTSNASFNDADIGRRLSAESAQFSARSIPISMLRMKVGSDALLSGAKLAGPLLLGNATIAGDLRSEHLEALGGVNMDSAHVNGTIDLGMRTLNGEMSMQDADVLDLKLWAQAEPLTPATVALSRTVVHRAFVLQGMTLNQLLVTSMKVEGPAKLRDIEVAELLNLDFSEFRDLDLPERWTREMSVRNMRLHGLVFKDLAVDGEVASRELIDLLSKSAATEMDSQAFKSLDAYYQSSGKPALSIDTYIAQRDHERDQKLAALGRDGIGGLPTFFSGLLDSLLGILVGYGRKPWLALLWSAGFVVFGWLLFRKRTGMKPLHDPDEYYNGLWYSLSLFLPFVDLLITKNWEPKKERRFARNYMRIHILLGWVLVPIGLAALTGIIQ